jgi:uroporphyrinogen-III synthase
MPRALTAEWHRVEPADEPAAAQRWRALRARLQRDGCHHWVFRSPSDPAAFLEFIEAADAPLLERARAAAGMPNAEILIELELS